MQDLGISEKKYVQCSTYKI